MHVCPKLPNFQEYREVEEEEYEENTRSYRYSTRSRRRLYEDFDDDSGPATPRNKSDDEDEIMATRKTRSMKPEPLENGDIKEENGEVNGVTSDSIPKSGSVNQLDEMDKETKKLIRMQKRRGSYFLTLWVKEM